MPIFFLCLRLFDIEFSCDVLEAEPSRFPMESRLWVDSGVVGGDNDLGVADEAFAPVPEGFDPRGEIPSGGGLCLFGDFFCR